MSSSTRKTSELETLRRTWRPLLLVAAISLGGCQMHASRDADGDADNARNATQQHAIDWTPTPLPQRPDDVWERIREGFQLQDEIGVNPRIERQRLWYASRPAVIESAGKRSSPYLHYVVERLDERDMPMELALLPVIESAYNPYAYSRSHAVGIWQFIPSTGRHFNLRQTNWYDGRRDITASTNAALAGVFQEGRIADEPQALVLDARVDADLVLQLEAVAHALPDVLGRLWLGVLVEPLGLLLQAHGAVGIATVVIARPHALAAGQSDAAQQGQSLAAARQRRRIESSER